MKICTQEAADFELNECHVINNEKVALDRLRLRQNVFLVLLYFYHYRADQFLTERVTRYVNDVETQKHEPRHGTTTGVQTAWTTLLPSLTWTSWPEGVEMVALDHLV